jgi:GT2 family glycosyltransferase
MKLSIIILCWNDLKVLPECLRSIFNQTRDLDFEVIIADNGSKDGTVEFVRGHFGSIQIIENGANLGFAGGNNAGIRIAQGEYVLILNPDTIIRDGALDKLVAFADRQPETGAFGCRVLNPDGTYQSPARPIPTIFGELVAALCLRWLGRWSEHFLSDIYSGWDGDTKRAIGYQSGCCVLFRRNLLMRLGGFDERFFYHFEETDLCFRVWKAGSSILFYPGAEITHFGAVSRGRFPIKNALETYRSAYRFFYKHYGAKAVIHLRWIYLLKLGLRLVGYSIVGVFRPGEVSHSRLEMYRAILMWNLQLEPRRFIEDGSEPQLGWDPLGAESGRG